MSLPCTFGSEVGKPESLNFILHCIDYKEKTKIRNNLYYLVRGQNTYGDANEGELLALTGCKGLIEIAVRNGSAKEMFRAHYRILHLRVR